MPAHDETDLLQRARAWADDDPVGWVTRLCAEVRPCLEEIG